MNIKNKFDVYIWVLICLTFFICFTFYGLWMHPIEGEYELTCNTGDLDFNFDTWNKGYPKNNSLVIKNFDMYGINGLKCSFKGKAKLPFIAFFGLIED